MDDLQPAIRVAIMSILAAVYESGTVDEVDLADVMKLFGVPPDPTIPITLFSFRDPSWVEAYINFRESDLDEIVDVDMAFEPGFLDEDINELEFNSGENPETNKKLH